MLFTSLHEVAQFHSYNLQDDIKIDETQINRSIILESIEIPEDQTLES